MAPDADRLLRHEPGHGRRHAANLEIAQAEARLERLDMVFARLMETRARISEAATAQKAEGVWEELVRGLSDADFANMSAQPDRFVHLLNQGGFDGRGIGESNDDGG